MASQYERGIVDEVTAQDYADRVVYNLTPQHEVVRSFDCHVDNWERMIKEVNRLGRKAAKLGYNAPILLYCPHDHIVARLVEVRDDEGNVTTVRRKYRMVKCVVAGHELKVNGWEIVAAVDWLDGKPVVRAFPGHEGEAIKVTTPICEHCCKIRSRNQTFILAKGTQQFQVGSTCLLDFCGIDPGYAAQVAALYQAGGVEPGSRYEEDLDASLAWWCLATRIAGRFVSRAQAEREYEADGTYGRLRPRTTAEDARALRQERYNNPQAPEPNDEDRALAEKVKAYVATLDPDQSDYNNNLRAIYDSGILLPRHEGLAASAVGSYLREEAKAAEARAQAESRRPSRHLGAVGERVQVAVKVTSCYVSEGAYGTTWIYRLMTPEGDKATWFSSREALEVGQDVTLVGTIKKLENYKGEDQTVLTRCREV